MTETAVHPEARAAWAKRLRRLRRALVPHRPKAFRDSLNRWLLMGTVIGIVSGIGAIIFFFCLETGTHYLLETLGGYTPPGTLGEGDGNPGTGLTRPWAIPLVVTGGALVSSILVYFVAPTAKGHGTDNAIHAVHHDPTALRGKVAVIKIIASSLMIGSGGSGGREGPTAQISATAISSLCKKLKIATPDARIAVSAATASGIGAIFRAPLGGALLGAELLYRDDMESDAIMPSLVSSIVAFVVFGSVYGFEPIFGSLSGVQFSQPLQLIWYVLLGLAAGLMGKFYVNVFYGGTKFFDRLKKVPGWLVPAIGGLGVGLLGLVIPAALGTGYGSVQQEMFADNLMRMPLLMVLAIPFAKVLSTTLSIGSGGSGGVFGPGMVIGGATGAALWRLLEGLPGIPSSPMSFVIVGMIACFGSVAHAPLGMLLMVGEMTGNLSMLAPGMIAVAVAGRGGG
ncbi:chloride transporter, ClC family protein, partial [Cutibacterium avidum TM16]|uniref:chloride channel protein n=1 Tax=Cutibacterium avidum TaxID=33010 RepID=UPI0003910D14